MNIDEITDDATPSEAVSASPQAVLESVVSELEVLHLDAPWMMGSDLVALHGALLLFNLDGRAELIPGGSWPLGWRRVTEMRVTRSARRLAGPERGTAAAEAAVERASQLIEELVHLIDADLRMAVAA
jgi:hypothetical protein